MRLTLAALFVAGTYGSFRLARTGYSIAHPITIGSYSDHSGEDDAYHRAEEALGTQAKRDVAVYDAYFARVGPSGPYAGWLSGMDRARRSELEGDYKNRLPAPVIPRKSDEWQLSAPGISGDFQLYVHMKQRASPLQQGRALVGFALTQAALGNAAGFTLPARPTAFATLAASLKHWSEADLFTGQPSLVATAILESHAQRAELAKVAADATVPPHVRLLARWIGAARERRPLGEADWSAATEAAKSMDSRTIWTWALVLHAESDQASSEAVLARHVPRPEDSSFADFLRSP